MLGYGDVEIDRVLDCLYPACMQEGFLRFLLGTPPGREFQEGFFMIPHETVIRKEVYCLRLFPLENFLREVIK